MMDIRIIGIRGPIDMQWFKVWTRCLDSRKVQQLPADVFRTWINLLCLASREEKDGVLPGLEDLAWSLRIGEDDIKRHIEALVAAGLIERERERFTMADWAKWQLPPANRESPAAAATRMRRYRQRQQERRAAGTIDPLPAAEVGALKALSYAEYLESEHWRKVRAFAVEACGGRCGMCDAPGPIEVHHRSYETLGRERPGDVIGLCPECHAKFHGFQPEDNGNAVV